MSDVNTMKDTPACHVCGSSKWVAVWEPDHPERAVCMDCCGTAQHHDGETGHHFEYEPYEGKVCRYCGSHE